MTNTKISFSIMSYEKNEDIRILTSCLSKWFSNPKILHFTSPSMRYPFKMEQWKSLSKSSQSTTLVIKSDNWILGHISIIMNNETKSAHIFHLIIDPKQQQKGYGGKLISFAEKFILKNNFKTITLNVLKKNQVAIKLYEEIGYTAIVKRKSKNIKMLKNL
tara:strand:- start:1650 stop:2132 length:483 start_codon:yes stop_codon:yes gene_type:complete